MNLKKIRILGSGFTNEEYELYRFEQLAKPEDAVRYMSHRQNHSIFRPAVNKGFQQHVLEDKWITQIFLAEIGVPVARTYGLFHPKFGSTLNGKPMVGAAHLAKLIEREIPLRLVFKPRGGRKGQHIIIADVAKRVDEAIEVRSSGKTMLLDKFLSDLPQDAFNDYKGCYHGWIVQEHIRQHPLLNTINPSTINSVRVVTFIDSSDEVHVHLAALRLGRKGSAADNWDKGGISVFVDPGTGELGRGVYKPRYGRGWLSEHPDTQVRFEGMKIPEWSSVIDICRRAASAFSGVRSVGWDVALTPEGPLLIEGNATWGLPVVQVHTQGYLQEPIRKQLAEVGAQFPEHLRPVPLALLALLVYQWRRSRAPRLVQRLTSQVKRFHIT